MSSTKQPPANVCFFKVFVQVQFSGRRAFSGFYSSMAQKSSCQAPIPVLSSTKGGPDLVASKAPDLAQLLGHSRPNTLLHQKSRQFTGNNRQTAVNLNLQYTAAAILRLKTCSFHCQDCRDCSNILAISVLHLQIAVCRLPHNCTYC